MDLSSMSLADLRNLQEQIKQETKKREHQEVQKARDQIMQIAQSIGMPLKDLMSVTARAPKAANAGTGSVAVRYRHPDDASQQWTGRGRQPKWVKEWVEGGKSIDQLRV